MSKKSPAEKRAEYIRRLYGGRFETARPRGVESLDALIARAAEADPTTHKSCMFWIVNRVMEDPAGNLVEDFEKVKEDLVVFERNKRKLARKDINGYRSFAALYNVIAPFLDAMPSCAEKKLAAARAGVIDVYKGPEGWIKIPTTREASCFLGQHTRWCTAGRSGEAFSHYHKRDPLFVIYDAATRERMQLHLATGQLADAADRHQDIGFLPKWALPILHAYYLRLFQEDYTGPHKKEQLDVATAFRILRTTGKTKGFAEAMDEKSAAAFALLRKYGLVNDR